MAYFTENLFKCGKFLLSTFFYSFLKDFDVSGHMDPPLFFREIYVGAERCVELEFALRRMSNYSFSYAFDSDPIHFHGDFGFFFLNFLVAHKDTAIFFIQDISL